MLEHLAPQDPRKVAAHRDGGRRYLFAGLAMMVLIPAAEATATDRVMEMALRPVRGDPQPPISLPQSSAAHPPGFASADIERGQTLQSNLSASPYGKWDLAWSSALLREPSIAGTAAYSSSEFRPRPRSILESQAVATRPGENLEFDKTVWQHLSDYKSRDRVRVLTLWESAASAVSIQTDRKGGPSLQWTSRWMNRGGATRGLLDHWLPATIRGFSRFSASAPSQPARPPALMLTPRPGFNTAP